MGFCFGGILVGSGGVVGMVEARVKEFGRRWKVKKSLEDVYVWGGENWEKTKKKEKYILLGRYIILMSRIGK